MSISLEMSRTPRAQAGNSVQQCAYPSLIPELTMEAKVTFQGLVGVADGDYKAVYEGRGSHRDVYLVDEQWALKLHHCDAPYNAREAAALTQTSDLHCSKFVKLRHHGRCTVVTESRAFEVDALLCDYGGMTVDKIMETAIQEPLNNRMVDFLISLYRQCGLMCIDGREQSLAFSDLHTANLATWSRPDQHVIGNDVLARVIDAEGCGVCVWERSDFNRLCDDMMNDLALQCSFSEHTCWKDFGLLWKNHIKHFFSIRGNASMSLVRRQFLEAVAAIQEQHGTSGAKRYAVRQAVLPVIRESYRSLSSACTPTGVAHTPPPPWRRAPPKLSSSTAASRLVAIEEEPSRKRKAALAEVSLSEDESLSPPHTATSVWVSSSEERYASCSSQRQPSMPWRARVVSHSDALPQRTTSTAAVHPLQNLRRAGVDEMQRQLSSKYRGPDRFQRQWADRLSWDDRIEANLWEHPPEMTRSQMDDVARLMHIAYSALQDILSKCSLNHLGVQQRRVLSEAEFIKHGMHKRVFAAINRFARETGEWFSPEAAVYTLVEEFRLLEGCGPRKYTIHGFRFDDDFHRDTKAKEIVLSYLAVGTLYTPKKKRYAV